MVIVINPKDENEFCLTDFLKSIKKLEFVLNNYKIYEKLEYKEWFDEFKEIYSKKEINLNLYIVFASIYLIGYIFVAKEILKKRISIPNVGRLLEFLQEVEDNINDKNNSLNIFELNYFNPIWRLSNEESLEFFLNSIVKFANFIFQQNISPEYFFDYIIQKLLPINTRHKSGEFYTPPFLVKSMVKESYKFGESILDPCCGSGNFLIEVIKLILCEDTRVEVKLRAIKKVFGVDINPISIYISKINIIFLLQDFVSHISLNLFKFDSLFHVEKNLNENFDLVLGNPPWYTYHNIESLQYQERIKNLAKDLNIKPLPKNLLNLEISTLFFIKAKNSFLKDGGKIFFVITKGVITGSHTSRFRNFRGFSEIMIWKFDKKLEKIFNIDFICLFGIKSENHSERFNREIKCYFFSITNENEKINYFDHIELKLVKTENLIPYDIEEKGGKVFTKKLISVKLKKKLIPFKESYYKPFFHKGADLNPRNLIFIRYDQLNESLVKIYPDKRIFKKAKEPWNKKEFENITIEKKYIFKVVKSTELVKFYIYDYYYVFLPISEKDLSFDYNKIDENAKQFYDKINNLYKKYKKETTKHKNLMENLNRWSKLINEKQNSKIKVVYNNSGSILNSAVIYGNYLVTGDLSFYDSDSLEEAFYLSAILNSNILTNQVQIIKSSRHIFKLPLDIPIEKYNANDNEHCLLSELGKKGYLISENSYKRYIKKHEGQATKIKIQYMLKQKLKPIISQIDEILTKKFQLR